MNQAFSSDSTLSPTPAKERIAAVDFWRGFLVLFGIMEIPIIAALGEMEPSPTLHFLRQQFEHSSWHGITLFDLGFPSFVAILGVSIPLALQNRASAGGGGKLIGAILWRSLLLFIIGVALTAWIHRAPRAGPAWSPPLSGILQRLAVCYCLGSLCFLCLRTRGLAMLTAALFLGYWAVMALIPAPGRERGDFSLEGNLARYVDERLLPGRALYSGWDPEGLLTTAPAVALCLMGVLAGKWFLYPLATKQRKAIDLGLVGLILMHVGYFWHFVFPINRYLWTSTFCVFTGGFTFFILALAYLVCDVWGWRRWIFPFDVVNRNALLAFIIGFVIPHSVLADWFRSFARPVLGQATPLAFVVVETTVLWFFYYLLYRRNAPLRV